MILACLPSLYSLVRLSVPPYIGMLVIVDFHPTSRFYWIRTFTPRSIDQPYPHRHSFITWLVKKIAPGPLSIPQGLEIAKRPSAHGVGKDGGQSCATLLLHGSRSTWALALRVFCCIIYPTMVAGCSTFRISSSRSMCSSLLFFWPSPSYGIASIPRSGPR